MTHIPERKDQAASQGTGSTIKATARRILGPFAWLLDILVLVPFLGLGKLFKFDEATANMTTGKEVLDWWSNDFQLEIQVDGLEHVPDRGPMLLYGNHPTGIGDGIAMRDALATKPNLNIALIMNAQGLEGTPAIADLAVHVGVKNGTRSGDRQVLWQNLQRAVDEGRTLVLFPAGYLSQPRRPWSNTLYEAPWRPGVTSIPAKFPDLPVIPFRIEARNRRLYYWLNRLIPPLKDALLYFEFHNKQGARYKITFLPPKTVSSPAEARTYVTGNEEGRLELKRK